MLGQIIISNSQGVNVKTFKVENLRTYIGRDKNCDIRVELKDIAPQHCLIIMPKSGFPATVRNLSQNNPTLVNGQVIGAADFELKDNDVLTVGTRKFEWKYCERNASDKQIVKKSMKRKRKSEPAPKQRLVAVVSPQRSDEKDLPPKKRRRTMFTNLPSSSGIGGGREFVASDLVHRRIPDKTALDFSRRNVEAIRASFSNIKKTATNRLLYSNLSNGSKSNNLNTRIPIKMNPGKGKPMQNLQSNIWQGNLVMFGNNYLNVVQTPHVSVRETSNISQTPVDVISSNTVTAKNSSNAKNTNKVIASKISPGKKSSLPKKNVVTPVTRQIQSNKNSPRKITTKLPSIVTPRQNEVKVNESERPHENGTSTSTPRIIRSPNTRSSSKVESPKLAIPKTKLSWKHTEGGPSQVEKIFLNSANTPASKKSLSKVKQNKSSLLLKAHTLTKSTSVHSSKKETLKMLNRTSNNSSLRNNDTSSKKVIKTKRNSKTFLVNASLKSSNTSSSSKVGTPLAYYTPKASPKKKSMKGSEKSSSKSKSITLDKGLLNSAKNSKKEKSLKVKKVISSVVKKPPLVARQSKRSFTLSPNSSSTQSSYRSLRSENTPSPSVRSNISKGSRLSNSALKISKNIIPETPSEQKSLNCTSEKELSSPKNSNTISETTIVNQGQVTPINKVKPNIVMRSSKRESLRRRIFDNSLNRNSEDNIFTDSSEKNSPTSSRSSFTSVDSIEKQTNVQHKSPVNRSFSKIDESQNRSPASGPRTPPNRGSLVVVMRSSKRDPLKKQFFNRSTENRENPNETPIKPSSLNSSNKFYKFIEKELKLSDIKKSSTSILELRDDKKKTVLKKSKSLSDIAQEGNNRPSEDFLDTSRASRSKIHGSNSAKTQSLSMTKSPQLDVSKKSVTKTLIREQNKEDKKLDEKESSVATLKQIETNDKKYIDKKELTKSLDLQQVKHCPRIRKCKSVVEMLSPKKRASNIMKMKSVSKEKSEAEINKSINSKISSSKLKDLKTESVNSSQEITPVSVSTRSGSLSLSKLKQLSDNSSISLDSLGISSPESSKKKSRHGVGNFSEIKLSPLKRTFVQTRKMLRSGNSSNAISKTLDRTLSQKKKIANLKENSSSNQSVPSVKFVSESKPTPLIKNTRQSTNRSAESSPQAAIIKKEGLQKRNSSLLDITTSKIITSTPRIVGRTSVKPSWDLLSETTDQSTVSNISRRSNRPKRSNSVPEVVSTKKASFIDKKLKWDDELSPVGRGEFTKDEITQECRNKNQKVLLKRSKSLSSITSHKTNNTGTKGSTSLTSLTSTTPKRGRQFSSISSIKNQSALSDQKKLNSTKKSVQNSKSSVIQVPKHGENSQKVNTSRRSRSLADISRTSTSNNQSAKEIHDSKDESKQKEISSKKRKVDIHSSVVDRIKEKSLSRKSKTSTSKESTNKKSVNKTSTPVRTTKKKLIFDIATSTPRSHVKKKSTSPKGKSPRQSNKNTKVLEVSQVKSRKGKLHSSLREKEKSLKKNYGRRRGNSLPVIILSSQKKPASLSNKKSKKQLESPNIPNKRRVTPAKENITPKNTIVPKVTMRSSKRSAVPKITYSPGSTPKSAITVRRNAMTGRKSFKITTPAMKRKLDALCLEKSKAAAKKLKSEPPKSLDKKKVAALLLCHKKKSPIKEEKKPLNKDIAKKNDSQKTPAKRSSLEKKSPKNAELSFKCSGPVVKKLRFAAPNDSTPTNLAIINRKKTPGKKKFSKEQTYDKSSSVSEIIEENIIEQETAQVDDIFSALYLSRKTSTAVQVTEKPYRRLRSSVNKLKNSSSPESSPSVQNVKHVAFATPLADYSVSDISKHVPSKLDFTANTSCFQKDSEQLYEIDDKNVANLKNMNQINVSGLKRTLQVSPVADYRNVSGVKKTLHITPEADYSTYVSGIKPTLQLSPQPDYNNVSGVKKTLHPTPDADYTNVSDLKRNLHISPQPDYTNVTGVKGIFALKSVSEYNLVPQRVFTTSPVANYTDVTGVKRLFTVPPTADYTNTRGLKELFPTDNSSYLNVSGVRELFKDPSSSPKQNENQNCSSTLNVDAVESEQTITRSGSKRKIEEQLDALPPATRQLRPRSENKKTLTSFADLTKKSSRRAKTKVNEQIITQEKCPASTSSTSPSISAENSNTMERTVLAATKEGNRRKLEEPEKPLRRTRSAKNIIQETTSSPVVAKRRRGKTTAEKVEIKEEVFNATTNNESTVKKVSKKNVEETKNKHNSEGKTQQSPPKRQTRSRSRATESSNSQSEEILTIKQKKIAELRSTRNRRLSSVTNKSNVSNNRRKVSSRKSGLLLVSSLKRMNQLKSTKTVHFELDSKNKKRTSKQNEMELRSADRSKRITRNESNKQKLSKTKLARQSVSPVVSTKVTRKSHSKESQTKKNIKRKSIEKKELPKRRKRSDNDSSTSKVNTRRGTKKK